MKNNLIDLIKENPELPIYAWVDGEVCADSCGYWLGQFGNAEIREYAKVETYGWEERDYVFKDDYDEYLDYLTTRNEDMTDEVAKRIISKLDYKKAIFVYVNTPDKF